MEHSSCHKHSASCHDTSKFDALLWGSLTGIVVLYLVALLLPPIWPQLFEYLPWLGKLAGAVYELMNTIWWGIVIGLLMVAVLSKIPKEFVISILGSGGGFRGILRATLGGVLLDLCSHGILMVGAKLYERGASAGQVMAFLVASPWNSFSLTFVLISLVGLSWTLAFIVLSMVIALITGLIFDGLVKREILPQNPNSVDLAKDFRFWAEARKGVSETTFDLAFFKDMIRAGLMESRMVLRWIFFGVLLAALVRAFLETGHFQTYFGPTLFGLGATVLVATIMEVCSEGSTPIAADLLTRAGAPGNGFAFLMAGVATDYTEIMVLKEATRSLKMALFLPLVTLPQVLLIAWVMNHFSV